MAEQQVAARAGVVAGQAFDVGDRLAVGKALVEVAGERAGVTHLAQRDARLDLDHAALLVGVPVAGVGPAQKRERSGSESNASSPPYRLGPPIAHSGSLPSE
jgi:hypothetical protein